jgi:Beta-catenin-interacting protein ICAT
MKEFESNLEKMTAGNMTLVDSIGNVQLAIQAAIRDAFKSPDVIRMFAKKENGALRSRLASIEQDYKLGRINDDTYYVLSHEVLLALQKLGEILTPNEQAMLNKVNTV